MANTSYRGPDQRVFERQASLSDSVRTALHVAAKRCMAAAEEGGSTSEALRCAARAARQQGIESEHVVRLIRSIWFETYPTVPPRVDHDRRLIHLIGTTLDAYFSADDRERPHGPTLRAD
jgi:hypothetical protein